MYLQDTSGLFIDKTTYPLDSSSSCQSSNSRLGDALNKTVSQFRKKESNNNLSAYLNVVPQDLAMPLGSTLSKTLASLATSRHGRDKADFNAREWIDNECVVKLVLRI